MAYRRMEVQDRNVHAGIPGTVINKALYDNLQDGIDEGRKQYANALTATISGTGQVSVLDAWNAPVLNLKVFGASEQEPDPSPDNPKEIKSVGDGKSVAVKVRGANLLDLKSINKTASAYGVTYTADVENGTIEINGTATHLFVVEIAIPTIPAGTKVYISADNPVAAANENVHIRLMKDTSVDTASIVGLHKVNASNLFTTTKDCNALNIRIGEGETVNKLVIKPLVAISDAPIPYEPYQSQTVTIPLTEPLRGIGDARDHVCLKDGEWGIERNFMQVNFDGSTDEPWWTFTTDTENVWRYKNESFKEIIKHEDKPSKPIKIICDRFLAGCSEDTYRRLSKLSSSVNGTITIYLEDFKSGDLDAFKTFLAKHPITAIFERAAPAWEPFPASTQAALNALLTYHGWTTVTVETDGPEADVRVEYVQDTRKVIEALEQRLKKLEEGR